MKTNDSTKDRFGKNMAGVLSCFDRLVLFGAYRPVCHPRAMSSQVHEDEVRLIDYKKQFADPLSLEMVSQMKAGAADEGVKIQHANASVEKEAFVSEILTKRGNAPGIVCILSAMESCRCFKVGKNYRTDYLELRWDYGKCIHYYVYIMDPDYGFCTLRIPTRAPFRLQFYFNGHDWLQRRMDSEGITYRKADNCFVDISDFKRARSIVDSFDVKPLHQRLDQYAGSFVAVHKRWGYGLHWSIFQGEWDNDIVFKSNRILFELNNELIRTAAMEIKCADIFNSLGRRLTEKPAR